MHRISGILLAVCVLNCGVIGCSRMYFGALEKLGYAKRELLVTRVKAARDAQSEGKVEFESALDKFRSVIETPGGKLESKYESLRTALDRSEAKAEEIRDRVAAVESVSEALFSEWKRELSQYENESLRRRSEQSLNETRTRYDRLIRAMRAARDRMDPALQPLRDNVLFLKHNLNAQAIGGLDDELVKVEGSVDELVRELERAIREANEFVEKMPE